MFEIKHLIVIIRRLAPLSISILLVFIFIGCQKSSSQSEDYTKYIVGTYKGLLPYGQVNGTVVLTRQSEVMVNIDLKIVGGDSTHYTNVRVSESSGLINIFLNSPDIYIRGTVNVTTLDCYFNQLHFVGTKR